jgi:hypothetical protein
MQGNLPFIVLPPSSRSVRYFYDKTKLCGRIEISASSGEYSMIYRVPGFLAVV